MSEMKTPDESSEETWPDDDAATDSVGLGYLWWMVVAVSALLAATALLPLLPVNWWWIRIGDFPRLQLLIFYLFGLAALLPFRRRKYAPFLGGLLVFCVGLQLFWIFAYLPIAPFEVESAQSMSRSSRIRILTANVLQENEDAARIRALIEMERPDIVALFEVNSRWIADLAELERRFEFHLTHPLENKYGIALYSNLEVKSARVRGMVKEDIPSIDAIVRLPSGREVRLFAVHPNPPRLGENTTKRDAELVLVGREVRNDGSVIVCGDMNDVAWSRTTNLFQEVSGLLDPRKGRGMFSTYDAKSLIWRFPLDYVFHSDDFRIVELKVLSDIGSDHFPLIVELSREPSAVDDQEAPSLDSDDREDAKDAVEKARSEVNSNRKSEVAQDN